MQWLQMPEVGKLAESVFQLFGALDLFDTYYEVGDEWRFDNEKMEILGHWGNSQWMYRLVLGHWSQWTIDPALI